LLSSGLGLAGGGVLCLGGAGLVVILAVGAFLFWLYRLGMDEELEDQKIGESGDWEMGESGNQDLGEWESEMAGDSPAP
jgi:hypothetical protein